MCSYYNKCSFEKDRSYRNNCGIRLHDGDLNIVSWKKKNRFSYVFFPFLCSAIPDLDLGILNMLIRECFRDVLQLAVC